MPVSINILRCTTKAVIAAYLLITLASCAGEESAAKKALAQSLKDPDSAKFGDVRLIGKNGACIPVNAKNSFGGYSGWKAFMLLKRENNWLPIMAIDTIEMCEYLVAKEVGESTK